MRIKLLEDVKHDGQSYIKDDVRTVPDAVGSFFCKNGWAEDTDGAVETGKRDTSPRKIQPADMVIFTR